MDFKVGDKVKIHYGNDNVQLKNLIIISITNEYIELICKDLEYIFVYLYIDNTIEINNLDSNLRFSYELKGVEYD